MADRTNADIIRIVKKWQEAGFVHPLTCRDENCRADLEAVEFDNAVALECPACGKMQLKIPDAVLNSEAQIDALAGQIGKMRTP